jgi:D-alanyl-D-alanine carboxypeptidase
MTMGRRVTMDRGRLGLMALAFGVGACSARSDIVCEPIRSPVTAQHRGGATMTETSTTHHHDAVSPATHDRFVDLIEHTADRRGVHHVNLAVIGGDGRHWSGAAGTADAEGTPLRPDTPFFIASVTKRFIITLVLQAHERAELHLDDPITEHLPPSVTDGLHVHGGRDHTAQITVRHLASHTSGLPDYFEKPREGTSLFQDLEAGNDRAWTFDDVVRMAKDDHRPHFAPQDLTASRQKARYSDTGFQLLIRTVETVTGRSYPQLLTERIIEPLGLDHTWLPGKTQPLTATPEPSGLFAKDRPLRLPQMIASCNDLMSTTGDLLRFQQALLAGELFHDPSTVELLTERSNVLRNAFPLRYGLGTMTFKVGRLSAPGSRPMTLVGHSGATGTWLFHCPELDLHLAGTIDQADGRALPFRLMVRVLRAWAR